MIVFANDHSFLLNNLLFAETTILHPSSFLNPIEL